jgi:hypothetical protein
MGKTTQVRVAKVSNRPKEPMNRPFVSNMAESSLTDPEAGR